MVCYGGNGGNDKCQIHFLSKKSKNQELLSSLGRPHKGIKGIAFDCQCGAVSNAALSIELSRWAYCIFRNVQSENPYSFKK